MTKTDVFSVAWTGELGAGSVGRDMHDTAQALESAAWSAAYGIATSAELALLEADQRAWRRSLELLLRETEGHLDTVRELEGPEREQVVADLEGVRAQLEAAYERLIGPSGPSAPVAAAVPVDSNLIADPPGEVRLQASWAAGQMVVWAAGPGTEPADNDALSDRLEAIGGPPLGWSVHPSVTLPTGARAAALAIPMKDALGWLVTVGGGVG
ncbi:MAG TPA: hypothetical protein VNY84_09800, partial [Acidimicrobiales bacterium]|nr:hypothetical protein [Acidimicrobiales bacterium]